MAVLSSIWQAIALTTYANAALAGGRVKFEPLGTPWFNSATLRFQVGDDPERQVAADAESWFDFLLGSGFTRAYLWLEPLGENAMHEINMMGFVGGERWAPVTCSPSVEVIWHERSGSRRGYRVMPGQASIRSTPEEATDQLRTSLQQMSAFERAHRPDEHFSKMFEAGLAVLRGCTPVTDKVRILFPADLYPDTSLRLVGAVDAAWVLGGMGWWNDWSSPDPEIRSEYERVTIAYYEAMAKALYAACA